MILSISPMTVLLLAAAATIVFTFCRIVCALCRVFETIPPDHTPTAKPRPRNDDDQGESRGRTQSLRAVS